MIPENLTDFLYWVKEQTELFWSIDPETSNNDFVCEDWIYKAKWIGLTEEQIQSVEKKYNIKFTPEHKEFLKILHTIDRKEIIEYTESFDDDAEILTKEIPFFYNWIEDEKEINERFKWPHKTILEDVLGANKVWLKSWGKRPDSTEEIENIFRDWYDKTPPLIPLTSHRFLVSDTNLEYRPVLSIYGSDTIVYGWDLRNYLLRELKDHLNMHVLVYDEEDKDYYPELKEEASVILKNDCVFNENKQIPYLQEMILIWNSGWSSFGLKYPSQEDNTAYPIMKTYYEDEEDNNQKTFTDF